MNAQEASFQAYLQSRPTLEGLWETYQETFGFQPARIWFPQDENSHWHHLAATVGVRPEDLHAWTAKHRGQYVQLGLQDMGVWDAFGITEALGTSDPLDPRWLEGSSFNVAELALAGDDESLALWARDESGAQVEWSRAELRERVQRLAGGLRQAGFEAGDAIALYLPMNAECVAMYLAIVWSGMRVVSIPDSFSPAEVATRLRLGAAKAVMTVDGFQRGTKWIDMFAKAVEAGAPRAIVLGNKANLRGDDLDFNALLQGAPIPAVPVAPGAVTNILFSSGTTGEPKAIGWTSCTPLKAALDGRYHQDIHGGDRVAWPTNIGWMMGPWLIYAALLNRAAIVLHVGAPNQPAFLQSMEDAEVTMLGVVPAIVKSWREAGLGNWGQFSKVRTFSNTGEASNIRDTLFLMGLAAWRAPVIEYCGGTEIGGGHLTGTVALPHMPASFNTPALGLDFVILDGEGEHAAPGEHGEIFLVPPSLGLSERLLNRDHHETYYAGLAPGPEGQVLRRHGDEVLVLENGWVAQGRADDTMNLGGIKVGSAELERAVAEVDGILDVAAVAMAPPEGGAEQLVLFAVVAEGKQGEALLAEANLALRTTLNPLFRATRLHVIEKLPRTASNKIMRRSLRDLLVEAS